ncbi:glycoside hydrolase family 18 protein [Psychromonas sp. Urea-02u-13]|uniref:glycoside hydrolase family 18 protein n=1 Tax=Psychromonas sp. Urea-02u-13 TaxID=2058326 RepID=UPI000C34C932|nr:glycoside hydrolase family 18 protein [Psychromonas sp. Urea-02u-13]PKG38147.1 chitinase [Psychromonas sp. Urea-02u-13]
MEFLNNKITKLSSLVALTLALGACSGANEEVKSTSSFEQSSGKVVGAYFPDWRIHGENIYTPAQIPAGDLTHVIYAFLTMCGTHPADTGEALLKQIEETCQDKPAFTAIVADQKAAYGLTLADGSEYEGHFEQFKVLKAANPHLVVLPSFGGWTMSQPFHEMIKTDAGRQQFVTSALKLVDDAEIFDGIDLDWEYPGGGGLTTASWDPKTKLSVDAMKHETEMFTVMLKELREGLDALGEKNGRYYELSAAAGVPATKVANINYPEASQYIDNWFAMTYDFFGGWSTNDIGHLSNLKGSGDLKWWSGSDGYIAGMLKAGLPAEKLVLGAAFYGRGWTGLENYPEGRPYAKNEDDTYANAAAGIKADLSYHEIQAMVNDKESGWVEFYDAKHEAAFAWNESEKGFISYDNARSVEAKGNWVLAQGFAGVFAWELTHDNNNELTKAMNKGVKNNPVK